jgi:hypothetical protein
MRFSLKTLYNTRMSLRHFILVIITALSLLFLHALPALASCPQKSSSSNYYVSECEFGIGGDPAQTGGAYNANASVGGLGVGGSSSTNYTSAAGYLTPSEEFLEMVVNAATIDLGTLSTATTATGTATFYVRAYTSSGYTVQTISGTPTNGAKSLDPMTSATTSNQGTEQFGINLVANSSPSTFGSDPAPQPNSGYAYGTAASGYDTDGIFKYNAGDTIATSPKGIGQTNFTISYIANISPITPGGVYSVDQVLVVVATY